MDETSGTGLLPQAAVPTRWSGKENMIKESVPPRLGSQGKLGLWPPSRERLVFSIRVTRLLFTFVL